MRASSIEDRHGRVLVREAIVATFFRQVPFAEWAAEVAAVFDHFRAIVPAGELRHARVGARASRDAPVLADTLPRCLAQLDPAKAAQRSLSSFVLAGPQPRHPTWRFEVWGGSDAVRDDASSRTNFVHVWLPTAWAEGEGDAVVAFVHACAERLSFDSAYAAPALLAHDDTARIEAGRRLVGLAMRHPGLDLPAPADLRFELGRRCVGARWLTLLGPELSSALGGPSALREALPTSIAITELARGLCLRVAGPPRAGDVHRGDRLPDLRALAAALEPVTHFAEHHPALTEGSTLERWQRRFLDP